MSDKKTYICPVCGWDKLREPPVNHNICASCGTQFGYEDYNCSHEELRRQWIDGGMKFFLDMRDRKPENWNPIEQLKNIGVTLKDKL